MLFRLFCHEKTPFEKDEKTPSRRKDEKTPSRRKDEIMPCEKKQNPPCEKTKFHRKRHFVIFFFSHGVFLFLACFFLGTHYLIPAVIIYLEQIYSQ